MGWLFSYRTMATLHYFNPGHETAVLNGSPYYMHPSNVKSMQEDLGFLPFCYALPEDYIFTEKKICPGFIQKMTDVLGPLAFPSTRDEMIRKGGDYPLLKACPWGLSPQSLQQFRYLTDHSSLRLEMPLWDDAIARLVSRETAAVCLRSLLRMLPEPDRMICPCFRYSIEEIEALVENSRQPVLLKAPYSSSGRGLLWVYPGELKATDRQWISGVLKKQGVVSLEPVLQKIQDFAMEFYSDGKGNVRFEGYSLFFTAGKGAYSGNYLAAQDAVRRKLSAYTGADLLDEIRDALEYLLGQVYGLLYEGYLGVDMMIYRNAAGVPSLHPCVEINVRHTMGLVALSIRERMLLTSSEGLFTVSYHAGEGEALSFHRKMEALHPLVFSGGKIRSGYLSFCPVSDATRYTATILVEEEAEKKSRLLSTEE